MFLALMQHPSAMPPPATAVVAPKPNVINNKATGGFTVATINQAVNL